MTSSTDRLFVSVKQKSVDDSSVLPTAFREIENWANQNIGTAGPQGYQGAQGASGGATAFDSGFLSADYNLNGTLSAYLSTNVLAVGTWMINLSGTYLVGFSSGGTNGLATLTVSQGTATATFSGALSTEIENFENVDLEVHAGLSFLAVITSAGAISFQGVTNSRACVVKANPLVNSTYPNATGYTALQI